MNQIRRRIAGLGVIAGTVAAFAAQAQQPMQVPAPLPLPAAAATPTPAPVQAQAAAPAATQTAEGAQKFLAALVKKGNAHTWFVDDQGRTNHVRGKAVTTRTDVGVLGSTERKTEKAIDKQLAVFSALEADSLAPDGKGDACMTRIARWETRETLSDTRTWQQTDEGFLIDTPILFSEISTYEIGKELQAPHWIDWRNVKIVRSTKGAQMTASFKGRNFVVHLAFVGESELVDRVEYAMKFLKMSCDDTASTGF
jgi:hypothetical protein